ncbi:MAG: NAD(P)-dependent oxidoreductase [Cohaesibacteraceae bacterium]
MSTDASSSLSWLVIGGTSGIGREVVRQLSVAGLPVKAFGRSAADAGFDAGVEPCVGEARYADDVCKALDGVSVVVQALGVKERPGMLWERETLFSEATHVLLPAMEAAGIKRLITVTGYGAGDTRASMSAPARLAQKLVLGRIYEDKGRQEELVKASDLDWTLVQPGLLTNGSLSKRYKVLSDPKSWHLGMISRADVADFVVSAGRDETHMRETVVLA